jgi:hypothetical protein
MDGGGCGKGPSALGGRAGGGAEGPRTEFEMENQGGLYKYADRKRSKSRGILKIFGSRLIISIQNRGCFENIRIVIINRDPN